MMDFETLKTTTGYVMQVNGKFYAVPQKYRHLNRTKLLDLFQKGEFKPVKQ